MSSINDDGDGDGQNAQSDEYGDMHKLVLQGIMSAGFLDAKGVKRLFIGACHHLKLREEERTTMPYVQKVVREINEKIRAYDMAIRSASCELTGKKFYIFLLTVEKPIMRFQNYFSKFEVEMFQKLMDMILRKYNNFSVPWAEAMNLAKEIDQRSSVSQGEEFINKMINLQYFAKYVISSEDYDVTLGVRTIREFEPILRDLYDDVVYNCTLCKMLLLHGYRCPSCPTLIHRPCYSRYIPGCKTCPNMECRANWAREKDMIVRVRNNDSEIEEPTEDSPGSQNQTSGESLSRLKKRWNKKKPSQDSDEEDNDVENSNNSVPMPVLEPVENLEPLTPEDDGKRGKEKSPSSTGKISTRSRRTRIIESDSDE